MTTETITTKGNHNTVPVAKNLLEDGMIRS